MTMLTKFAIGLLAGYGLLLIAVYFGQRALMYHPDATRRDPARLGLMNVTERVLSTSDGNRLIAWQVKATAGKPTILYFHGNAGNLSDRAERMAAMQAKGWGVFMLSYRGYSGSTGKPSEKANLSDADLALATLIKDGVGLNDIVLYGASLGSGIAAQLAAKHSAIAGLILDAPYTSMADAAAVHYPWLWVRPFVIDRYDTRAIINSIACPILILHGEMDRVIPVDMGRELARIAVERVTLVTYADGGHTDLYNHGAMTAVTRFIKGLGRKEPGHKEPGRKDQGRAVATPADR